MNTTDDLALEKGLPVNPYCERLVLGSILLNEVVYSQVAAAVEMDDFSLLKHRRIYARMKDLFDRGERIDRVTVANELMLQGQLESVDGLSYLVSLDEGLPEIANLESYIRIISDYSIKRKLICAHQGAIVQLLRNEEQAGDLIDSSERAIAEVRTAQRQGSEFLTCREIIAAEGGLDSFMSPEAIRGTPSPWTALNVILTGGGFAPGQLVVMGGRPASGKTAVATNIAVSNAAIGCRTFYVSLEMSSQDMLRRMLATKAKVNFARFRYADAGPSERDAITRALFELDGDEGAMLSVWDAPGVSVMTLRAALRREAARGPIGMVVLDYIQLMQCFSVRGSNRTLEISEMSRGLKLLAMELKCPLLVLSQLSRDSAKEGREPELHDLRDSGALEQDADIVMFPHVTDTNPDPAAAVIDMELLVKKQRNGPVGRVALEFTRRFTRFDERAG